MSGFDLRGKHQTPEEYVDQLRVILEHDCLGARKKESCHQLGEFYQAVEKNSSKAKDVFKTNCEEMNFPQSCFSLGIIHLTNKEDRKPDEALSLFNKACEKNVWGACNNAGLLYQKGEKHFHIPRNMDKAMQSFTKACDGNFRNGCFNLSIAHLTGFQGVDKDMVKALEYSVKSCKLGHSWGCINASRIYSQGDGVDIDMKKAEEFRKLAKDCQ